MDRFGVLESAVADGTLYVSYHKGTESIGSF